MVGFPEKVVYCEGEGDKKFLDLEHRKLPGPVESAIQTLTIVASLSNVNLIRRGKMMAG